MATLKTIRADILALESLLIENDAEINSTLEEWMKINEQNLAEKIDGYYLLISHLETSCEFYKEREKEAYTVRKTYENQISRMKDNIKFTMSELDTLELKGNNYRYKLSLSKPKVVINDDSKIPNEYIVETIIRNVDKDLVKHALDLGIELEGVSLEQTQSLRSYLNKKEN